MLLHQHVHASTLALSKQAGLSYPDRQVMSFKHRFNTGIVKWLIIEVVWGKDDSLPEYSTWDTTGGSLLPTFGKEGNKAGVWT